MGEQDKPVGSSKGLDLQYTHFMARHPDYDVNHWDELEALYKGGRHVLNRAMLERLLPKHRDELAPVYDERCKRAFYLPYAGEIVDHIVASLFTDPPEMTTEAEAGSAEDKAEDDYYDDFEKNCAPERADRKTFSDFLREQILWALVHRVSWSLVDLPRSEVEYKTLREEEDAGVRNAYVLRIPRKQVVDWEEDEDGALEWAMTMRDTTRRARITASRNVVTRRFTIYTRDGWEIYEISWDREDKPNGPAETDLVKFVDDGKHSFGVVPLIRMSLPEGLWAMEKLDSLARALFNQTNALEWATIQSLFQELYEFEGPEDPMAGGAVSEAQQDENRATNQTRGQGWVQTRGSEDRAEFIGPDTGAFDFALKSTMTKRDEMHRVTHKMALTVDNSPSALRRSGESKKEDKADTTTVLQAFGVYVRRHAEDLMRTISMGRGETKMAEDWQARGLEHYDLVSVSTALADAVVLDQVRIPSATFAKRQAFRLAKIVGGEELTDEDLDLIEAEIELNIVDEMFEPVLPMAPGDLVDPDDDDDGEEGDDDGDTGERAPEPPKGKNGRRRLTR